jgi:hypothetical protein
VVGIASLAIAQSLHSVEALPARTRTWGGPEVALMAAFATPVLLWNLFGIANLFWSAISLLPTSGGTIRTSGDQLLLLCGGPEVEGAWRSSP